MRGHRLTRGCALLALVVVAVCAPSAAGATAAPALPSVAVHDGQVTVAWTSGGVVQVATRSVGGRWSRGVAVGRALGEIGARSPQIAVAPDGEQVLLWQSGNLLRAASRASASRAWSIETLAEVGED